MNSASIQSTNAGGADVFLSEINPTGSTLLYSTYLGGSGSDQASGGLALDSANNVYIAGYTQSSDFPTTAGALRTAYAGNTDAFVAKIAISSPTSVALNSSLSSLEFGQTITFTATVTSSSGTPTGEVLNKRQVSDNVVIPPRDLVILSEDVRGQ